ncbi:2-amino-4-hydroxy-6-hydroxymethyldihydropteridine diphosphokinase [Legionella nagasakiensis]|uniref:2-amino-4-hydroxy-6- hydroxymethyldihydropteridine diphosphokinase n=1 Tax=Legionella nagasakiensis TaxID=535290 RepID=UPI001054880A|nr:2-amino-4-hydroxy-6-hydroxymethyldihydropteridine diphosphokinase [Legionella nagasakiensis]
MTHCYLGLGSNLSWPQRQLNQAIANIKKLPRTKIIKSSSFYFSNPMGSRFQPRYCNMVLAIHTTLSARHLLRSCQAIEKKHQRIRKKKWGARTLDIDVLLYGAQSINTYDYVVPHREIMKRDFVLIPLLEIAPNLTLPDGKKIENGLVHCTRFIIACSLKNTGFVECLPNTPHLIESKIG